MELEKEFDRARRYAAPFAGHVRHRPLQRSTTPRPPDGRHRPAEFGRLVKATPFNDLGARRRRGVRDHPARDRDRRRRDQANACDRRAEQRAAQRWHDHSITISLGSRRSSRDQSVEDLIRAADRALTRPRPRTQLHCCIRRTDQRRQRHAATAAALRRRGRGRLVNRGSSGPRIIVWEPFQRFGQASAS